MTSEDQLRAALLGGGQLTAMLATSRRSMPALQTQRELRWTSSLHAQGALRSAESATDVSMLVLMRGSIVRRATLETEKLHKPIDQAYEVEGGALLSASQDAQWQSLRRNVFHRLGTLYAFRESAKVKSFLERNFFLTPLLLQASDRIRERFGSATIFLEVSTDPDDGNYQELWARIQTDSAPAAALSALTKFDEEWWLEASASSHDLLNIKLEYV